MALQNQGYIIFVQNFKQWLSIIGYSWQSIKHYPIILQEFFSWLEAKNYIHIDQITASIVKEYYEYLKTRPNKSRSGALSKHSLNNHISGLKAFNKYLKNYRKKGLPLHLTAEKIDPLESRRIVSQEEIKEIFQATYYSHKEESTQLRDRAILVVLYSCGLRVNEAYHLDVEDILFDAQRIYVKKGKNYKERFVPLNGYNLHILTDYIYEARPLFMIDRNITPHKLRHSIATHLLQQKASIKAISQFLGHASLEPTQLYTHILQNK